MVKLNSGDHLEHGASRDWGFEDIVIKDGKVGYAHVGERSPLILLPTLRLMQVVEDIGIPGTENEEDCPVGPHFTEVEVISRM